MFVLLFAERPVRAQLIANKLSQANKPVDILKKILWADGRLKKCRSFRQLTERYRKPQKRRLHARLFQRHDHTHKSWHELA
jgi:hypothetical protein